MTETFCVYAGPLLRIPTRHKDKVQEFIENNEDMDVFIPQTNERTYFYVLPELRIISGRQSTVSPNGNQEPLMGFRPNEETEDFKGLIEPFINWANKPSSDIVWAVLPYYK